jgi:diketogulonate reductase-like aldo/keto reductase
MTEEVAESDVKAEKSDLTVYSAECIIGFGTYRMIGNECYNAVLNALQTGYRLIDTAEVCAFVVVFVF